MCRRPIAAFASMKALCRELHNSVGTAAGLNEPLRAVTDSSFGLELQQKHMYSICFNKETSVEKGNEKARYNQPFADTFVES